MNVNKTFKKLAVGAAVAGLFAGVAMTPGCGDSKDKTEANGCGGPNGCGGSNGCSGPNGCNGQHNKEKAPEKATEKANETKDAAKGQ